MIGPWQPRRGGGRTCRPTSTSGSGSCSKPRFISTPASTQPIGQASSRTEPVRHLGSGARSCRGRRQRAQGRGRPGGRNYVRVNTVLIAAWTRVLAPSDWLYVLDWQHPGYRCWPHRVDAPTTPNTMPVEVFPNGDYYIFLSSALQYGTFAHPWEASLCVWGDQLIDAVAAVDSDCLNAHPPTQRPGDGLRPVTKRSVIPGAAGSGAWRGTG